MTSDTLLTTAQTAALLGCTVGHVRRLAASGRLSADRRYAGSHLLLFDPGEVERYARERRPVGRPAGWRSNEGSPR